MSLATVKPLSVTSKDRSKRFTRVFAAPVSPSSLTHPPVADSVDHCPERAQYPGSLESDRHFPQPRQVPPLPTFPSNRRAAVLLPSSWTDFTPASGYSPKESHHVAHRTWQEPSALRPSRTEPTLLPASSPICSPSSPTESNNMTIQTRKSHRYCTTFDLESNILRPPPRKIFAETPAPKRLSFLPSFSDSESDSDSLSHPVSSHNASAFTPEIMCASASSYSSDFSSLEDITLGFPQPPTTAPAMSPVDAVVLRDPDSGSPLVTQEETGAVREFLRERWMARLKAKQERFPAPHNSPRHPCDLAEDHSRIARDSDTSDYSWKAEEDATSPSLVEVNSGGVWQDESSKERRFGSCRPWGSPAHERPYESPASDSEGDYRDDVSLANRLLKEMENGGNGGNRGRINPLYEARSAKRDSTRLGNFVDSYGNPILPEDQQRMEVRETKFGNTSNASRPDGVLPPSLPPAVSVPDVPQGVKRELPSKRMPNIIRKVSSMRLGVQECDKNTGSSNKPSFMPRMRASTTGSSSRLSPKRSSALLRLDVSMSKLKTQHDPQRRQSPALPPPHHMKSRSLGCMKPNTEERKARGGEAGGAGGASASPDVLVAPPGNPQKTLPGIARLDASLAKLKVHAPGSTPAASRMHHLKSQSLACLSKPMEPPPPLAGRHPFERDAPSTMGGVAPGVPRTVPTPKPLPPSDQGVTTGRRVSRWLAARQAAGLHRSTSFASLALHREQQQQQQHQHQHQHQPYHIRRPDRHASAELLPGAAEWCALGSPFLHYMDKREGDGVTDHGPPLRGLHERNSHGILKSFMNVTPEQETKRAPSGLKLQKERMRKFLARASGGVVGWGKFLTGKA